MRDWAGEWTPRTNSVGRTGDKLGSVEVLSLDQIEDGLARRSPAGNRSFAAARSETALVGDLWESAATALLKYERTLSCIFGDVKCVADFGQLVPSYRFPPRVITQFVLLRLSRNYRRNARPTRCAAALETRLTGRSLPASHFTLCGGPVGGVVADISAGCTRALILVDSGIFEPSQRQKLTRQEYRSRILGPHDRIGQRNW